MLPGIGLLLYVFPTYSPEPYLSPHARHATEGGIEPIDSSIKLIEMS
jgi:hypothetical protein